MTTPDKVQIDPAGLLARLTWVTEEAKRFPSARQWAKAALLHATHVTTLAGRLKRAIDEGTTVSVETPTLLALARAAMVSFEWLASGVGQPDAPEVSGPREVGERRFLESVEAQWPARLDEARAFVHEMRGHAFSGAEGWHGPAWEDALLGRFNARRKGGGIFGAGAREVTDDD